MRFVTDWLKQIVLSRNEENTNEGSNDVEQASVRLPFQAPVDGNLGVIEIISDCAKLSISFVIAFFLSMIPPHSDANDAGAADPNAEELIAAVP